MVKSLELLLHLLFPGVKSGRNVACRGYERIENIKGYGEEFGIIATSFIPWTRNISLLQKSVIKYNS